LRNGAAVANLNTLIYVLLNLRTLQRIASGCKAAARLTRTTTSPKPPH